MADTAIYGKRSQGADIFIVVVRVFIYRDENSRQKANCGAEFYRLCRRDFHRVYRGGVEHGDGGAVLSFLIAISIYCALSLILDIMERKRPFRKFLKGEVLTIIEEGEFNYENLKKSKLDVEDVLGMAREKNFFDVNDIAFALFETTGKLSILPKSNKRPTVLKDLGKEEDSACPPDYVIVNGKPQYRVIRDLGLSMEEVFERLRIRSKRELNDILVASYDGEKGEYQVHRK